MQIRQLVEKSLTEWNSYNLGATFENVFLNAKSNFSLENLYNHYTDFLNNAHFIRMSSVEPESTNVKIWYETGEDFNQ